DVVVLPLRNIWLNSLSADSCHSSGTSAASALIRVHSNKVSVVGSPLATPCKNATSYGKGSGLSLSLLQPVRLVDITILPILAAEARRKSRRVSLAICLLLKKMALAKQR